MLCSLTLIQWSAFSPGREFTHIAKILSNGMIFFPFSSGHGTADWDWQSLTQQQVDSREWLYPSGQLGHDAQVQYSVEGLAPYVPHTSIIHSPNFQKDGKKYKHGLQAELYVLFFFFFPIRARILTVGKQVILLERTEWVCTSKARLSRQCGMTNAVLWSCRNGRLKLVFIPGGFTPTCKTGCKGTVSGIRFS